MLCPYPIHLSCSHACPAAAANRCAWVTGEDFEEEDEEVFSLTHKLPLVVENTWLNMIDKSASVSQMKMDYGGHEPSVACPFLLYSILRICSKFMVIHVLPHAPIIADLAPLKQGLKCHNGVWISQKGTV